MSVGVDAFGEVMPELKNWTLDAANFTHVLSIYGGHFQDMLFHAVGFPEKLTAVMQNQLPMTMIAETGEKLPYTSANEVMVIGTLEGGGLFRFSSKEDKFTAQVCKSTSQALKEPCGSPTHAGSRTQMTTRLPG